MNRTCTIRNEHDALSYTLQIADGDCVRLSIFEARDPTVRLDVVAHDDLRGWYEAAFDDRDLFAFFEATEAAYGRAAMERMAA